MACGLRFAASPYTEYETPHRTEFVIAQRRRRDHTATSPRRDSSPVSILSSTVSESLRQSPPPREYVTPSVSSETLGSATRAALCVPLGEGAALGRDEAGEAD